MQPKLLPLRCYKIKIFYLVEFSAGLMHADKCNSITGKATARGGWKLLLHVSVPKETEDMSISLPCVGFLMFSP